MQRRRIEVIIDPKSRRPWSENTTERPHQTAERLIRQCSGVIPALERARDQMHLHAPQFMVPEDIGDAVRMAQLEHRNATRSSESYERWRAVLVFLAGRLSDDERRRFRLRPRQKPVRKAA